MQGPKGSFTNEYFLSRIQELNKDKDYEILSHCENSHTMVKIKHKKCNQEFEVMAKEFVRGDGKDTGCPYCYKTHAWTLEECQNVIAETRPQYEILNLYTEIVEYTNPKVKKKRRHLAMLQVHCKICNHIWDVRLESFMHKGYGCPKCARKLVGLKCRLPIETVAAKIHNKFHGEYELTENRIFDHNTGRVEIRHIPCGTVYNPLYYDLMREDRCDQRCPKCFGKIYSSGELMLTEIFTKMGITFESQKRFSDCRNINPLPFDFYLPEYNTCVEFDGIQHFQIVEEWGGEAGLKDRQYWDKFKDDYCLKNNIHILRIRYDQVNNMQQIIEDFLMQINE